MAASETVSQQRRLYSQCGPIDLVTYHKAAASHSAQDLIRLQRLQTLGFWTDAQQGAYYQDPLEGNCFHCGKPMGNVMHLWECEGIKKSRIEADAELADIEVTKIPAHIWLGVPSVRPAEPSATLCPILDQGAGANWDIEAIFKTGVDLNDDLVAAFRSTGIHGSGLNCQELAYKILGCLGPSPAPRVSWCNDVPPPKPNVFTDGSYLHPGANMALGTFGSWEPGRDLGQFTPEEADFCLPVALCNEGKTPGIMMAGTIPGVFNSSTRTELASIIAALPKPGALHFGLDNLTVCSGVQCIVEGRRNSKRDWRLRADGDLWQVAECAILARNPKSIAATWTKGHATWKHIIDGVTTEANAIGNGLADLAADQGHATAGRQQEQCVLSYVAASQERYAVLVHRLQKYALAILEADRAARKEKDFKVQGKSATVRWIVIPSEPKPRPDYFNGHALDLLEVPPELARKHAEIIQFLSLVHFNTTAGEPTTWLEIYVLFRLWGGGNMAHKDVHAPRPTFKALLSSFTRDFKAIVHAAGASSSRQAIACHKGKDLLLSDYGLYCHMSAIGATLCVEPAISIEIHNMLMAIRKAKGPTGDDMLKSTSLPLPKFEPWIPFVGKASLSLPSLVHRRSAKLIDNIDFKGQRGEDKDFRAPCFMLTCPKCKTIKDAARCRLYAAATRLFLH